MKKKGKKMLNNNNNNNKNLRNRFGPPIATSSKICRTVYLNLPSCLLS